MRGELLLEIKRVWHEGDGFRKYRILNLAILESSGDYLLFSDGDCMPRSDFVSQHRRLGRRGRFLSGGYFKLPMQLSQAITAGDIRAGRPFNARWLCAGDRRCPSGCCG